MDDRRSAVGFTVCMLWLTWGFVLLTLATSWLWAVGLYTFLLLGLMVVAAVVWENSA